MITDALAKLLRQACDGAPKNERVVTIHLFGIRHAEELTGRYDELADHSGIGRSYGAELSKGARLAPYVILKS